jgi:hypothetical protein
MGNIVDIVADIFIYTGNFVQGFSLKILSGLLPEEYVPSATTRELKDRTATVVDSESPHSYIYGRARVGSSIVAVLTSGAKDEYKHIVCVHAAHECDAIEEIYINGKALGTLDGNGNVTSGDYFTRLVFQHSLRFSGSSITLPHTPIAGTLRMFYECGEGEYPSSCEQGFTLVGNLLTAPNVQSYTVNYSYNVDFPYVRVSKHLGDPNQAADANLIAELPAKWDSTKRLHGMCYTVIRLNLYFEDFKAGCPDIEALIRGKKIHDVRSVSYPYDTPAWSQNTTNIMADYLTSDMCRVPVSDLPLPDYITAANVCDETNVYGAKYLTNGVVTADDEQGEVLNKMAQSMAGSIVSTTWGVMAGKYVAPVMSLSQSDIVGDMSYTSGVSEGDLFNGIKGQYVSAANLYVATDFAPYQNTTYVNNDGLELWNDIDFLWTDNKQRVHNLARIFTEDQRNGFTIQADFSYKAWALKIGERVTFTSTLLGQTNKVYRVMNKTFAIDSAVSLTLKEDAASIWDLADSVLADDTPNTDLPSPLYVPPPGDVQVVESLYETTNSNGVKVKATVTWVAPEDVSVLDYTVEYKRYEDAQFTVVLYSTNTQLELLDITPGKYDIRVQARNHLNIKSDYSTLKTVTIYGLTAIPGDVVNFSGKAFNGAMLCQWDRTVDLDVKIGGDIEIRFCPVVSGASWEQSLILPDGKYNGDATSAIVSLGTGVYYAKFKDSSGNFSENAASFIATESLVTGWTTVFTSTQHATFTGTKTNCAVNTGILSITDTTLPAVYEFAATMDCGSVITRRFHAHIKSLSYSVTDLFDSKAVNFDDAMGLFDGGAINSTAATVYASISNDNISYSTWIPFMVADFNCRYVKFKMLFSTTDSVNNIDISELSVAAKVTP